MPLSYLKQEIVAKEKSYGQENLKAKKIWDKRNAIKNNIFMKFGSLRV